MTYIANTIMQYPRAVEVRRADAQWPAPWKHYAWTDFVAEYGNFVGDHVGANIATFGTDCFFADSDVFNVRRA